MAKNDILAKMAVLISADTAKFNTALKQSQNQLSAFQKGVAGIASSLLAGFSVAAVTSFAFEISKLAGEAEGVKAAFDKLPDSINLMNRLKDATAGTVSELDLMKRAVMANNFGISLEALPKLLEFASVRAKQTGQSVDYLVDSIVTGIGRKSKLILDNLGISAVQLTEALGGASTASASIEDVANAVGAIAEKELLKMGSMSENASTKIERLSASWVNLKVALGDTANGTGILGAALDALTASVDVAASKNLGFWEKLTFYVSGPGVKASMIIKDIAERSKEAAEQQKKHAQVIKEVDRAMASENPEAYIKAMQSHIYFADIMVEYNTRLTASEKEKGAEIENITNLTEKLNLLNVDQLTLTGAQLMATNKEIKSIEEKIKKLRELGVEQTKAVKAPTVFTDDEMRQGRIAGLERSLTTPKAETNQFGADGLDAVKGIDSMNAAYQNLTATIERLNATQDLNNQKLKENQEAWIGFAQSTGDSVAQAIAADESLGKSSAKVAAKIIDDLQAIAMAKILANAAKLGLPGVIAAVAGLSIVKGLFAKLSRRKDEFGSSGGFTPSARAGSYPMAGDSQSSVSFQIRGQDLVGTINNFNRNNQYTYAGG